MKLKPPADLLLQYQRRGKGHGHEDMEMETVTLLRVLRRCKLHQMNGLTIAKQMAKFQAKRTMDKKFDFLTGHLCPTSTLRPTWSWSPARMGLGKPGPMPSE